MVYQEISHPMGPRDVEQKANPARKAKSCSRKYGQKREESLVEAENS